MRVPFILVLRIGIDYSFCLRTAASGIARSAQNLAGHTQDVVERVAVAIHVEHRPKSGSRSSCTTASTAKQAGIRDVTRESIGGRILLAFDLLRNR
jgi:hypothetical protein